MKTYHENRHDHCHETPEILYEMIEESSSSISPFADVEMHEDMASSSTYLLHENTTQNDCPSYLNSVNSNKESESSNKNINQTSNISLGSFTSRFSPRYTSRFHHNDGVFTNLSAKPDLSKEKIEEFPPSYEQAAADVTPSYWENTMVAPGVSPDEVFINGLPVGTIFGFLWNMLISFSFQFIGFLLTYLLHTTHAAKNGSKAGLGTTLVQYGFYMRSIKDSTFNQDTSEIAPEDSDQDYQTNSLDHIIVSYLLMIAGWFILIRSTADFLKARRIDMCVRETSSSSNNNIQTTQRDTLEGAV